MTTMEMETRRERGLKRIAKEESREKGEIGRSERRTTDTGKGGKMRGKKRGVKD